MAEDLVGVALSKCSLLVSPSKNISQKDICGLFSYLRHSLSDEELKIFIDVGQSLFNRKTLGCRNIKITANAIKLCLKLNEYEVHTFPYIEKIARKGFDTSGGTYSFCMPTLTAYPCADNNIYSYGPIEKLIKRNANLDIKTSHFGFLEVNFK